LLIAIKNKPLEQSGGLFLFGLFSNPRIWRSGQSRSVKILSMACPQPSKLI